MLRDSRQSLEDIRSACEKILRFAQGMSIDLFVADERTYDAVIRNLEVIGESARNLPDEFRASRPEVEWRRIIGLRNIVLHQYFGIDNDIIWDVVRNHVPVLLQQVSAMLGGDQT